MNKGRMAFTQIIDFASQDIFKVCVNRYNGNYKAKEFTCWKQFLCMAFGQLTHRQSMSDTLLCLKLNSDKLYHLGIGKAINKSTLSRANESRDWRIYQDYALKQIKQEKKMYEGDNQLEVNLKDRKFQVWQRNSLSIDLRTKKVYEQKLNYIHNNPVKAGICIFEEEYKYSSAKFYITNEKDCDFLEQGDE